MDRYSVFYITLKKTEMGKTCSTYWKTRSSYRVLLGSLMEGSYLEEPGVDGRVILNWISDKWDGMHGLDRHGSRQGQVACCCECGDEHSGCIECEELLD